MTEDYVVIRALSPNARGDAICAFAYLVVKGNTIVEKGYELLDPEEAFDPVFNEITGTPQGDVSPGPTLQDFWLRLETVLRGQVVVAHHARYTLALLKASLKRYGITAPDFHFYSTLNLSRSCMERPSYDLEALSEFIGFPFVRGDLEGEVRAVQNLFAFLCAQFNLEKEKPAVLSQGICEGLDENLAARLNQLAGILEGIDADGQIDAREAARLEKWVEDNREYGIYAIFARIIRRLESMLEDHEIDEYERMELEMLAASMKESRIYHETALSLHILRGIMDGVVCNGKLENREVLRLRNWIRLHRDLRGVYPYDKAAWLISEAIADGVLETEEKEGLFQVFEEFSASS